MQSLPDNIAAVYQGSIPHDDVASALVRADLFFLPTRGENFGHVLLEAWSAGAPVLTSDQTPWRQLESEGVGWTIPLTEPQRFVEVIGDVSKWTSQQHSDCRSKCIAFAREHSLDGSAIEANRKMFSQVLVGLSD
jgi:glycosyltransferase involved in cell wall biosynthesis